MPSSSRRISHSLYSRRVRRGALASTATSIRARSSSETANRSSCCVTSSRKRRAGQQVLWRSRQCHRGRRRGAAPASIDPLALDQKSRPVQVRPLSPAERPVPALARLPPDEHRLPRSVEKEARAPFLIHYTPPEIDQHKRGIYRARKQPECGSVQEIAITPVEITMAANRTT